MWEPPTVQPTVEDYTPHPVNVERRMNSLALALGLFALLSFDPRVEVAALAEPDAAEVLAVSLEGGA